MKSKKKLITSIILLIVGIISSFFQSFYFWFTSSRVTCSYSPIDGTYYKIERYNSDTTQLIKEYYTEDNDINTYQNVDKNTKLIEDNTKTAIDNIHKYDNKIEIEFDYNKIKPDNYYTISYIDEYVNLKYYDKNEHILYKISYSQEQE